jgi:hypothetical protein
MQRIHFLIAASAALLLPSPASAQLLMSERLEGLRKLCIYSVPPGPLSGNNNEGQVEVGAAQNCPQVRPLPPGDGSLPGTAQLRSWTVENGRRTCLYEYSGRVWPTTVAINVTCPMIAAYLPPESR